MAKGGCVNKRIDMYKIYAINKTVIDEIDYLKFKRKINNSIQTQYIIW